MKYLLIALVCFASCKSEPTKEELLRNARKECLKADIARLRALQDFRASQTVESGQTLIKREQELQHAEFVHDSLARTMHFSVQ